MEAILLRIPVAVISWADYDMYKEDIEILKLRGPPFPCFPARRERERVRWGMQRGRWASCR